MRNHRKARNQTILRLPAQFLNFIIGKLRQDGIAPICHKGTALGNFRCIFNRFRQISKKRNHFLLGFEIMLSSQPATGFLLIDISAVGNAEQSIMGFVHFCVRKIDIIGCHQRYTQRIG